MEQATDYRASGKDVSFEEGMRLRIGALVHERDMLEEEVRQLRAAVDLYVEIVRRLQVGEPRRAA